MMLTPFWTAVAVGLVVVFVVWWVSGGGKRPPGPLGLPIVGYIPFLSKLPHLDLQRLAKQYGNVFSLRLGSRYVVVLNDFQSTKEAFAQDAFMGRPLQSAVKLNKETIETGALLGLPWKEQRRYALHMLRDLGLGKSKMEEFIQEEIAELLKHFESNVDKPFSIRDLLAPSMSNNIGALLFGKRFKYDDPVRKMLSRSVNDLASSLGQVAWPLFFPWLKTLMEFFGVGDFDVVNRTIKDLVDYIMKEINEHEEALNPDNVKDFIDGYLLEIRKRKDNPAFCKNVLQDISIGLFGAGSETVRLSVEWLVLTVATHHEAQRHIQAEIDDVVGSNRLPQGSDQKSMPYTDAFIMELMRWRTIIPINVLRYTLTDTELNGYFIPKHAYVLANLWSIHHNTEYWGQDADDFRPERFLTEDGKTVKKMDHYIPFSIGKRACPGEPLAKVEVFLYFTSILQKFNVSLPEGRRADFEGELGIGYKPKLQEVILTKRS